MKRRLDTESVKVDRLTYRTIKDRARREDRTIISMIRLMAVTYEALSKDQLVSHR